ncbi:MAG: hypothetical protein V1900_02295 [Candidatus Aenigmatarchaeota archaeon]
MARIFLCAVVALLMIPAAMAYIDDADFYKDSIKITNALVYQWDIIKIKITNPSANVNNALRDSYIVRLNNSHSDVNITVTETEVSTGIFEGEFQAAETLSSNATSSTYPYPRINCSGGDNVTAKVDLDNDGSYSIIKIVFDVKDNIIVFKSPSTGVKKADKIDYSPLYFKENDTVYVVVYAKASAENRSLNVSVVGEADSILLSLNEDASYDGKYTINFTVVSSATVAATRTIRATHDKSIRLESDVANDGKKDSDIPVAIDNIPPHILRVLPTDKSFKHNSSARNINITLIESHPKGSIDIYYFRANGTEDINSDGVMDPGEYRKETMLGTESMYYITINDSFVPNGRNVSFWIYAEDAAGNILTDGGSSTSPLVTYTIDNLDPIITVAGAPTINDTMQLNLDANGTISPITSLRYSIYNSSFVYNESLSCSLAYCTINHSKNMINLPIGIFNMTIFATDSADNSANSTLYINSSSYFNVTGVVVSNPTSSRRSALIDISITLKGDTLKFKLSNITSTTGTLGYNDCSQCFFLIYKNSQGTTNTIPVYNDYTEVSSFYDTYASTLVKDVQVTFRINVTNQTVGNYNGTYYIKDGTEISGTFITTVTNETGAITNPTVETTNESIDIVSYNASLSIVQGASKNTTLVVKNTGKSTLTGITMTISGVTFYSLKSSVSSLNSNENGSFVFDFTVPNDVAIKNYDVTASVSASGTTTVTDSVAFTLNVLPSNSTIVIINNTYNNYLDEVSKLREMIKYLQGKGIDVQALLKQLEELENKLKNAKGAMNDNDYSKAKNILDGTGIDDLRNRISALSGIDIFALIPYIVVITIIVILAYLFWPTKD